MRFTIYLLTPLLILSGCSGSNNQTSSIYINNDNKPMEQQNKIEDERESDLPEKAIIKTNFGDITLELFSKKSPITVGNFVKLAREGFYDGTRFHRVISNFMIQGGDPLTKDLANKSQWGTGGPGYTIEDEFVEGLSNVSGTIAMANTGRPNSGGSQFFINVADNTNLDWDKQPLASKHPVFGKVADGIEIVNTIKDIETGERDIPSQDVIIESIEIIE